MSTPLQTPAGETQGLCTRITEEIIAELEKGTTPWQRSWTGSGSIWWPTNAVTTKRYRGINFITLLSGSGADPRWCTRKQAERRGWRVHPDAVPRWICFYARVAVKHQAGGQQATVPMMRNSQVFHASQLDGIPPLDNRAQFPDGWSPVDAADRILRGSSACIRHGGGDAAYVIASDSIVLPQVTSFRTPADYYATALHELGHWTGHPDRLNRQLARQFGRPEYAREELRVEIASAMLSVATGVPHDPSAHAQYVGSWLTALRKDRQEIFRAASDAQRITDYLLALGDQPISSSAARPVAADLPSPSDGKRAQVQPGWSWT